MPRVIMLYMVLYVGLSPDPASSSQCQTQDGPAAWWAVFRHAQSGIYLTVDSNYDDIIQLQHPWDESSPLRTTFEAAELDSDDTDYVTYYTDSLRAALTPGASVPPIVGGMVVNHFGFLTSTGFWIIHNNTYFPPKDRGTIIEDAQDYKWFTATTDDLAAGSDMFYFCISIDSESHLEKLLDVWILTNPSLSAGRLQDDLWLDFLNETTNSAHGFTYTLTEDAVTDCVGSTGNDVTDACLRRYLDVQTGLQILVRLPGVTWHKRKPCLDFLRGPNENGWPVWDMWYDQSHGYQGQQRSQGVFAISGSVVCFGSNIADNPDSTTVMACVQHQELAMQLLAADLYMDVSCTSVLLDGFDKNRHQQQCHSSGMCDDPDGNYVGMKETPANRRKVRYLRRNEDLMKYLVRNSNAVLAVFCRKGCRFCDNLGHKVDELASSVWKELDVDVVVADIMTYGFPEELLVDQTPTLRYRESGDGRRSWYRVSVGMPPPSDVIKYINDIQNRYDINEGDADEPFSIIRNQGSDGKDTKDKVLRRRKRTLSEDEVEPQPKKVKQESGAVRTRSQTAKLGKVDDSAGIETPGSSCQQKDTEFVRCISSVTRNSHDICIRDLPGDYLPPDKTHCTLDRRLLFGKPGKSGCTVIRANLVCGGNQIYTAVCANGPIKKNSEVTRRTQGWHAEGHLRKQIEKDSDKITSEVENLGHKYPCQYNMVMNNSPCRDVCSGANKNGHQNIPTAVNLLRGKLQKLITELKVKIVFGYAYSNRRDGNENFKDLKEAINSLINLKYTVKRCRFDHTWWEELKKSVENKKEVDQVERDRKEYDAELTEKMKNNGLEVDFDLEPCISPGN